MGFGKSDEDLKMIGVSIIDSLFSKFKIDGKGTGEESTLVRRCPDNSKGENLVEKIDEIGFGDQNFNYWCAHSFGLQRL